MTDKKQIKLRCVDCKNYNTCDPIQKRAADKYKQYSCLERQ